jgi:energy-coupling factor transporter ATP-binding protein EcfA2
MMTRLAIAGYRSLRDIRVALTALNVVTGANGSGKSSLYRALRLLADHRARPHHPVIGRRRWPAIDLVGGTGGIFPRHEVRHTTGAGIGSQESGEPEARIFG